MSRLAAVSLGLSLLLAPVLAAADRTIVRPAEPVRAWPAPGRDYRFYGYPLSLHRGCILPIVHLEVRPRRIRRHK